MKEYALGGLVGASLVLLVGSMLGITGAPADNETAWAETNGLCIVSEIEGTENWWIAHTTSKDEWEENDRGIRGESIKMATYEQMLLLTRKRLNQGNIVVIQHPDGKHDYIQPIPKCICD